MSKPWHIVPIDANTAAEALGISRRTLDDVLKRWPHYERRGNRRVFYPEHIEALRLEMNRCGSRLSGAKDGPTLTELPPAALASDALSKLVILSARRKRERS